MVVTDYGIKYAVHIVTNQFGPLVSKVCECLLRKGPLPVRDVCRCTELNPNQVKDVLYVLTQHNCVQAFSREQPGAIGSDPKLVVSFMVLFDNILHRGRYSKFLKIATEELGEQCREVLDDLLANGRLTLGQMSDRARENGISPDAVRDSLHKLVTAHYVERIPASEPVLATPTEEETASKKRGSKSAKLIEELETLEQRVLEAAMPVGGIRFSLITETESNTFGENSDTDSSQMISGVKRKKDDMESKKEPSDTNQEVIWRPNFEEFIRRLRHKACLKVVKERLDDGAATVFSAMLAATRSEEKRVKTAESAPISVNSIYEEVIKSEAGRNMTLERVETSLNQLSSEFPFVKESDELYRIEFKRIIEKAQEDEVESVVLRRYGKDAFRMFRFLSKEQCLVESDKIADTAFIEKKEATKILYKLWKDEYLHMEKLVVTGGRQSNFLLWKVNKRILWEHVLNEMFHASLNLSLRLAYELEQAKEVLNVPPDKIDGKLKEKQTKIREMRLLLASSRLELDDAIMLFHHF